MVLVLSKPKKVLKVSLHWSWRGDSLQSQRCARMQVVTAASVPTADPATGQDNVSAPNVYYLMMLLTFQKMKYQNPYKLGSSQPICCGPYSSVRLRL